jgi:hypothetical protein
MKKGIVWYTGNRVDPLLTSAVQNQLQRSGLPIVSVSLQPIPFGDQNAVLSLGYGIPTMFKQILAGIEVSDADVIFLCEDDMIYHQSHFEFMPGEDTFWYNENDWKVRVPDGQALFYICKQTGFCCANRRLLLEHYRTRVARVEAEGFRRYNGFEPGTHRSPRGYCNYGAKAWMSPTPNLDIRHQQNLTWSRWRKDQFRREPQQWQMADSVPGWGQTKVSIIEILESLAKD